MIELFLNSHNAPLANTANAGNCRPADLESLVGDSRNQLQCGLFENSALDPHAPEVGNAMTDLPQLQQALYQALQNLQRCGLQRFPSSASDELTARLQSFAAELRAPASAPPARSSGNPGSSGSVAAPQATVQQARASSSAPQQAIPQPQPATPHHAANPPASGQAPAGAGSRAVAGSIEGVVAPWSLPVLSLGERQTYFDALQTRIKNCRLCEDIVCYRQQTVFGTGPLTPTVCFMGEAPGADEDRQGVPFVGRAGQLLTKIIEAMQLKRDDVFILNALKCRPPQNRTPVPEEIENCRPFVVQQLDILQPKYIVCLGAVAVRSLLGSTLSVGSLRGRFHHYGQAKVVVTYHPSYLLRNESAKKLVWQDMQMLMHELGLKVPGKPK